MTDITMPRLSDSMEEGTILSWLRAAGEHVEAGDELVEIETDKATMTYESPEAGVLAIVAPQGTTLPVGAVIARVGSEAAQPDAPAAEPEPEPDGAVLAPPRPAVAVARATPLARRFAARHGVELGDLAGSGPSGRIVRADVARRAGLAEPAVAPHPAVAAPSQPGAAKGEPTIEQLTRLQQTVARRMAESKATVPHFQVQCEVEMGAALALRRQLKELAPDAAPSINDLIVKAAAIALRRHPRANGAYRDGLFELYPRINVGIAVAAADALVVPTITDADTRGLGDIAAEARRLAARVRSGEITPAELSGATFTVSNLGMYGMSAIYPVVNVPQAAILGVGAIRQLPALQDGALIERDLLTLTLSCDHRILYGAKRQRSCRRSAICLRSRCSWHCRSHG
jgi:pyruvate dehydrogenase E2 component (dihydrolipoamide acetyltransferase)